MSSTIEFIRTYLTRILIIVTVVTILLSYFALSTQAVDFATELRKQNTNIGTFALFTGLIVIIIRFGRNIVQKAEDWPFSIYALGVMALWIPLGIWVGISSDAYIKAYYSTKVALHAGAIALLIFFNLSAVYRVFRIKDFRGAILPIASALLVAANAPWAQSLFPGIGTVGSWVMDNLQMPGARTITLVSAIGGLALGVRILMGWERGALRAVRPAEGGGED
jgi:hypothetical protein